MEIFLEIYFNQKVDIFKDYITLPGVARKMIYQSSDSQFALFNKDNADLYYSFKQNIVGQVLYFLHIMKKMHQKLRNNRKKHVKQ